MASEKRKKNRVNQFGDHKVTFTVTVAKAFPSGNIYSPILLITKSVCVGFDFGGEGWEGILSAFHKTVNWSIVLLIILLA